MVVACLAACPVVAARDVGGPCAALWECFRGDFPPAEGEIATAVAACDDAAERDAVWADAASRRSLPIMLALARAGGRAAWHRALGDAYARERLFARAADAYGDCAAAVAGAPMADALRAAVRRGALLHSDARSCAEAAAGAALDAGNVTLALALRRGLRDAAGAVPGAVGADAAREYAELALATGSLGAGVRALVAAEAAAAGAAAADAATRRSRDAGAADARSPAAGVGHVVEERAALLLWARVEALARRGGHLLRARGREGAVRDAFAANCGTPGAGQLSAFVYVCGGGGAFRCMRRRPVANEKDSASVPSRRRALEQHD